MCNLQFNYITILSQKQQYIVNYHKRQAIFLSCWRAVRDSGKALGSIADERPWPLVPRQSTTSCPLFLKLKSVTSLSAFPLPKKSFALQNLFREPYFFRSTSVGLRNNLEYEFSFKTTRKKDRLSPTKRSLSHADEHP